MEIGKTNNIKILNWNQDVYFFILLCISCFLFLSQLKKTIDLALWDEVYYLSSANSFSHTFKFPGVNWAPLYTLWYYLLSLLFNNPIDLYYINIFFLTTLSPLIAFWVAIRFKVPAILAFLLGLLLLTNYLNLEVSPKPAQLSLSILLLSFGITTYYNSNIYKLLVLGFGTLLSSFIRPELFLSFILIDFLIVSYIIFYAKGIQKQILKPSILWICAITVLFYFLGVPLLTDDDRSLMAFGQHFAQRWTIWTHSELNPQLNWEFILKQNFGNANSYPELFLNNPSLFLKHVMANGLELIKNIRFVFYHYPFFLESSKMAINGLLTLVIFGGFMIYRFKVIISSFKDHLIESVCVAIICFPCILSCILIYPRMHYLLTVAVLSLVWIVILASKGLKITGCVPLVIIPLTMIYFMPNPLFSIKPLLKNKKSFDLIQSKQSENIRLLESGAGLGFYFQNAARFVITDFPESLTPTQYINENQINTIFIDYYFEKQPAFLKGKLWKYWLLNGFKKDGFAKYNIHGNLVYLKTKQ